MERIDWLESELNQWSKDYGHGSPEWLGYPKTNILDPRHSGNSGFVRSSSRTTSDDVEDIVRDMRANGFWKHACILTCDYFAKHLTMEMRLDKLKNLGVPCTRRGYYDYLAPAKMYVLGARMTQKARRQAA